LPMLIGNGCCSPEGSRSAAIASATAALLAAGAPHADARRLPQLALRVPAELEVVGEDDIRLGAQVPPKLGRLLGLVEVGADVLGLHPADGEAFP
jgi:hypothetical protein